MLQAKSHSVRKLRLYSILWLLWLFALMSTAVAGTEPQMSTSEIRTSIQTIAAELRQHYVDPVKANTAANKLLSTLASGGFDRAFDQRRFHHEVSTLLNQATGDRSISLLPNDMPLSGHFATITPSTSTDARVKVEISPDNIGYLSFEGQFTLVHSQLLLQQLRSLEHVEALILDVRLADDISLPLVQQLMSYFVPADTALMNVTFNHRVDTLTAVALADAPHFANKVPLYVVTSAFVAGNWELFCFSLQQLERAFIVGDATMGLSHLTTVVKVSDATVLRMSYGAFSQPQSGDSWHLEGVLPDYYFSGEAALSKAYQLAHQKIKPAQG